jgi:ribose 5-phosphate isomerase
MIWKAMEEQRPQEVHGEGTGETWVLAVEKLSQRKK